MCSVMTNELLWAPIISFLKSTLPNEYLPEDLARYLGELYRDHHSVFSYLVEILYPIIAVTTSGVAHMVGRKDRLLQGRELHVIHKERTRVERWLEIRSYCSMAETRIEAISKSIPKLGYPAEIIVLLVAVNSVIRAAWERTVELRKAVASSMDMFLATAKELYTSPLSPRKA